PDAGTTATGHQPDGATHQSGGEHRADPLRSETPAAASRGDNGGPPSHSATDGGHTADGGSAATHDGGQARADGDGSRDGGSDAPPAHHQGDGGDPPNQGDRNGQQGDRQAPTRDGDTSAAGDRDKPKWYQFKKRFEVSYETALADPFGASPEGGLDGRQPPHLTPEMVQQALNARPESLNHYGRHLRNYLEQHFSQPDGAGGRRPLDAAAIGNKLDQLRGSSAHPTRPENGRHADPEPSDDGTTTTDPEHAGADGSTRPDDATPVPDGERMPAEPGVREPDGT
ncbi:hypothetical protein ACFQ0D_35410, partial [Micromonospora zhanjiangensis]